MEKETRKEFEDLLQYGPVEVRENFTINRMRVMTHHFDGTIWVDLTPVMYNDKYKTYGVAYDRNPAHQGFSIPVHRCERKSRKKMGVIHDAVLAASDDIIGKFSSGDFEGVKETVNGIVSNLKI